MIEHTQSRFELFPNLSPGCKRDTALNDRGPIRFIRERPTKNAAVIHFTGEFSLQIMGQRYLLAGFFSIHIL